MRSKSFWETKREDARDRLDVLEHKKRACEIHLRVNKLSWKKRRRRLSPLRREMLRFRIDQGVSLIAKLDREIHKLKTTKIPYYEQMLERESKTVWHRIRTGDGLRV